MIRCIFEQASGLYLRGARHDEPAYDGGTEVLLTLDRDTFPDARTERWDGATGTRAATTGEMDAYDDAVKDAAATIDLSKPVTVVLRDILWDIELRLRAAGQTSAESDIAAAADKTAYTQALKTRVKAKL